MLFKALNLENMCLGFFSTDAHEKNASPLKYQTEVSKKVRLAYSEKFSFQHVHDFVSSFWCFCIHFPSLTLPSSPLIDNLVCGGTHD